MIVGFQITLTILLVLFIIMVLAVFILIILAFIHGIKKFLEYGE